MHKDYYLETVDDRLQLCKRDSKLSPIYVDFIAGSLGHRFKFGGGRRQLLSRAVGLHKVKHLTILDLSAGLGRDAFVLASLGGSVTMLERSPVIAQLLEDGLRRARQQPWFAELELKLVEADALTYLQTLESEQLPDVIYYDPMFPERQKSALVKKEMRVLRDIVGDDQDIEGVLDMARHKAKKRVVVKRSTLAPAIAEPSLVLKGKSCRYDVYLV